MNYTCTAKIWKWPGNMGWHFITLPRELAHTIATTHPKGMIPITATVGATTWDTALFPHNPSGYLLPIKASTRKAEDLWEGETITVHWVVRKK
jgi:hypothetical protein